MQFLCSNYKAVICLSEHWLHSFECDFLSSVSRQYNFSVECVPDYEDAVYCYPQILRGHGGSAILWHRDLNDFISIVQSPQSDRIVGIRFSCSPKDILVFSVYLPARMGSTDNFRDLLDLMDSTFLQYPDCTILFKGDFNNLGSSISSPNEQCKILRHYLDLWSYVSSHLVHQTHGSSHTFESEAHHSPSDIDHILCPSSFLPRVKKSFVLSNHPLNSSDHLAVYASILPSLYPLLGQSYLGSPLFLTTQF